MDPYLYKPIFLHFVIIFSFLEALRHTKDEILIPSKSNEKYKIYTLSIILILFLGLRPISWAFADTGNYANSYAIMALYRNETITSDIFFYGIMKWFAESGINVHIWILFVEVIYILGHSYATYKLFPYHTGTAFAIILTSFSFFSYSTNGIRNGMACALFLMALPFIKEKKWVKAILLCVISFNVHSSLFLPIMAILIAHFYQNTKHYIVCWIICITASIVAGGFFEDLLMNQGIIDTGKDTAYFSNDNMDMSQFSHQGFRFDFLIYSSIPIIIGYYFINKQKFNDKWYQILVNTYIICNSIWVLVNANWLSNRIAYLSWFLYGYIIIYPMLMCPNIRQRNIKLKLIVLGNAAFTYCMWIIGKYN